MVFSLLALAALPAALGVAVLFDSSGPDETDTDTDDDLAQPDASGDGGDLLSMALEAPVAEPLEGTMGDDTLIGSDGADEIVGGRGDDRIDGFAGADTLLGGWGDDLIYAGPGDDVLGGGNGDDTLFAGAGADLSRGGAGADRLITGWDGADSLYGNAGDDVLINDTARGNLLDGGAGDDLIDSAAGAGNTLSGGAGDDTVFLGSALANDAVQPGTVVDLGTGADTFHGIGGATIDAGATEGETTGETAGDGASDLIHLYLGNAETTVIENFERGVDRLDLTGFDDAAIRYDALSLTTEGEDLHLAYDGERFATLAGLGGATLGDLFPEAQSGGILGGLGDDLLMGGRAGDYLAGLDGNDTIHADAGDDTAYGGDGGDLIYAGPGDDWLEGGAGGDTLVAGQGDDSLFGGADADRLIAGATGFDLLDGGEGGDLLTSHSTDGGDTFLGGTGDDTIDLAERGTFFETGWAGNLAEGGAGDDELTASVTGFDTLKGGPGDDTLISGAGTAGASYLDGGADDDHLIGLAAGDTLIGGIGRDLIDGTAATGMDLRGGSGADTILSGLGNTVTLGNDADHGPDELVLDLTKGSGITTITDFDAEAHGLTVLGAKGELSLVDTEDTSAALLLDGETVVARFDGLAGTALDQIRAAASTGLATPGDDTILGGAGDDTLLGGGGDDRILDRDRNLPGAMDEDGYFPVPVADDDLLSGGAGNDTLIAQNGADTLLGGEGDDLLVDGLMYGGSFDQVSAADDPAVMDGGAGNDTLIGSLGDTMAGGSGADWFSLSVDGSEPIVITDFTPGEDVLQLEAEHGALEGVTDFTQEVLADGSGLKITVTGWSSVTPILLQGVTAPLDAASFPQAFATADA